MRVQAFPGTYFGREFPRFNAYECAITFSPQAGCAALTTGIEHLCIEGVELPVYGIAKTIAGCFKHRRHIAEDVSMEALRDALQQRQKTAGVWQVEHSDRRRNCSLAIKSPNTRAEAPGRL